MIDGRFDCEGTDGVEFLQTMCSRRTLVGSDFELNYGEKKPTKIESMELNAMMMQKPSTFSKMLYCISDVEMKSQDKS